MRRVVLAAVSVALVAASCAGDRPTFADSVAREVDGGAASTTTLANHDAERRVFRMAVVGEWGGDPADAGPASVTNRALADFLFDGLTELGPTGTPQPALAERWFVSEDRLTWTFVLPEGLVDGSGAPLTARDVKHSLEAVAARGPADQAATALVSVVGWVNRMNETAGGVSGIAAPDETTLVVQVESPFELLPHVLASPAFGITGRDADGERRTTGPYRWGEDGNTLLAVDADAVVPEIALVRTDGDPTWLVAQDLVDWAVLPPTADVSGFDADVVRQPLDVRVVVVFRLPGVAERLGAMSLIEPLLLATEIEGLAPEASTRPPGAGELPLGVVVDVPEGILEPLGLELAAQLEAAGIAILAARSPESDFADRVASGEAVVFPAIVAGGTGSAGAMLRLAIPGGVDDLFGAPSPERAELAAAVASTTDPEERQLFLDALEQSLVMEGFVLPVGQFEVRVAVSRDLRGLRHRMDGTIDLSGVTSPG